MGSDSSYVVPNLTALTRLRRGVAQPTWLGWPLFSLNALSFAVFVLITLYGRAGLVELGRKGTWWVPLAVLIALAVWQLAAGRLLFRPRGRPDPLAGLQVAATFAPMLLTLPVTLGVLGSESFAREYWISRSLKVELLVGPPVLALALQVGLWVWVRHQLTWRRAGLMLAVLAVGFALRWAGMGWGLPFAYQPEETSIYFRWAMELALGGQWNPHYFQNPSLLIYLLGLEFMAVFALCRALLFGSDPGELYMLFRGEQQLFYGLGRLNSVVLGTATLLVVYLIGRRLWSERGGLMAAGLLAVNFLHVRNSQYAVNDVPSAFFLALSFFFALRVAEEGRMRHYLLAGLMAGLAASTKYNAGMVVVAIAVAHWLYHGRLAVGLGLRPLTRLGLSAVAALGGFVLGTPYSILDFPGFYGGFLSQLDLGKMSWSGQSAEPIAWQFLAGAGHGAGLVAAALALLGGVLLLVRERRRAFLLLVFPAAYFGFMSAVDLFFVRWVIPVTPFVALLAAYGLERILVARPQGIPRLVATILVALTLLQPAVYSLRLDWLAYQEDTRREANRWAEQHLPAGSKVAIEAFSLLDQESLSFRATLQQLDVELVWRATMHDLDYYRDNGFDYLAVSSFLYDRAFAQPDKYPDRVEFYQRLEREFPRLAVFSPRSDGRPTPFALDDLDTPFWHLFSYDRPGPTIKVYRLSG